MRFKIFFKSSITILISYLFLVLITLSTFSFFAYNNLVDLRHELEEKISYQELLDTHYRLMNNLNRWVSNYITDIKNIAEDAVKVRQQLENLNTKNKDSFDTIKTLKRLAEELEASVIMINSTKDNFIIAKNQNAIRENINTSILLLTKLNAQLGADSLNVSKAILDNFIFPIIFVAALSIALSFLILYWFHIAKRRYEESANILQQGITHLTQGDLRKNIPVKENDDFGDIAVLINKMISEIDTLNSQLIQNFKLASVGTIASGLAHELNNPLTSVLGHLQILQKKPRTYEESLDMYKKMTQSATRMKNLIDHLRSYSRQSQDSQIEKIKIDQVIKSSFTLLETQLANRSIEIRYNFPEDIPCVLADSTKLESVFQNLIINARDAFEDISKKEKSKVLEISIIKEIETIKIIVKDNATGMDEATLEKVFAPFFTTKPDGKGTGLGLSIAKGIIEEFEGNITCKSKLNEGTIFEITLPIVKDKCAENITEQLPEISPTIDNQTTLGHSQEKSDSRKKILIVDDESFILEVLESILEDDFLVETTTDPENALGLIKSKRYDIIITDYLMPKVTGLDVIKKSKELQPETKLVLISGHILTEDEEKIIAAGANKILHKPFTNPDFILEIMHAFHK